MKKAFFVLAFAVLVTMALGCGAITPNYFSYRDQDFSAEVRGEVNGVAFAARITYSVGEGGAKRMVEYVGTGNLAGITVVALPNGSAELEREGVTVASERGMLAGLLLPIDSLLADSELASVRKDGERHLLTLQDGACLTLDNALCPLAFQSSSLSMDVIRWACGVQ
ncbi:MAG: hypothetical protein IJW16_00255 [Clostridia bacterium]|nr:hypothetical protein [Clostridia bacterium]